MHLEFSENYTVTYSHIDNRGIARPSALADFMQDLATLHAQKLGLDRDGVSMIWILSRMKICFQRPIRPYENIQATTWCNDIKGASWYRSFSFHINGELVATAVTSWVILNPTTHRIVRPSAIPNYESLIHPTRNHSDVLDKIVDTECIPCRKHIVSYSDLDINNHLNNVKIIDIVSDALELNLSDNQYVKEFQINYAAESKYNDELILSKHTACDHSVLINGTCQAKDRFQARLILSHIS